MEVHPPHQPIHTVKDFLLHLLTITVGLLIALGLEGLVEWNHHRNLVKEARADLREELAKNHSNALADLQELKADEERISSDIKALLSIRAGGKENSLSLDYTLHWKELANSAWKTAGSSGALSYMDFESERSLGSVYYVQDEIIARNLANLLRDHSLAPASIVALGSPEKCTKEELQMGLQRSADLLMDLKSMEIILASLDKDYAEELAKL